MSARPSLLAALAVVAAGGAALAQDLSWRIPERGVVEFERHTERLDLRPLPPDSRLAQRAVPTARLGDCKWRYWEYSVLPPPSRWIEPDFDDSAWQQGLGGFGGDRREDGIRTRWTKKGICLRAAFDAPKRAVGAVLTLRHDDDVQVWINGVLAFEETGAQGYRHHQLPREAVAAIAKRDNVLAVKCINAQGAQAIDVGLTVFWRTPPSEDEFDQALAPPDGGSGDTRRALFPEIRSPALLFEGEFDSRKRGPLAFPKDLRDLAAHFALDLSTLQSKTIKATAPRLPGFGDVVVRGTAEPATEAGAQEMSLRLRSTKPAANGDSKRYVERFVLPECRRRFEGEIHITRQVDAEAGVVRSFETSLRGRVTDDKESWAFDLVHDETWKLRAVRENRDAAFRTAVNDAIRRGRDWLRAKIKNLADDQIDGKVAGDRSYGSGRLALALLALVKSGLHTEDAVVKRGFDELRRRELVDTYSLANAIMAFEALYAPAGERNDLVSGVISAPRRRVLPDADRKLVEEWTHKLLGNVDNRVDPAYLLRFNYVPGGRYDHSVNQYGLLGLYSAHLCGVEISPTVWHAAANHLIDDQGKARRKLRLSLVTYAQQRQGKGVRTVTQPLVPIAAWGYYGPKDGAGVPEPMWGSMVTAGITGLTICEAGLRDCGMVRDPIMAKADDAVNSGFAWLADRFAVRWHPGALKRTYHHHYYYLYGLERACELSGLALLQDRDWYFEGAMALMAWQRKDGRFRPEWSSEMDITRTSMAVLFLRKSSLPVYTR